MLVFAIGIGADTGGKNIRGKRNTHRLISVKTEKSDKHRRDYGSGGQTCKSCANPRSKPADYVDDYFCKHKDSSFL